MKRFCRQVVLRLVLLALPLVSKARRTTGSQTKRQHHRLLPTYPHYSPNAPIESPHIIGYTDEADCEGWGEGTPFFGQLQIPVNIFRSSAASGSSETSRYWYHNNCQHNTGSIQPILGATFSPTPPPMEQPSPSPSERPSMILEPTLTPSDFPSLNPTASTKPSITNEPTTTMMLSLAPSVSHETLVSDQPAASAVPSSLSSSATNAPTPSNSSDKLQQPPSVTFAPSATLGDPTITTTIQPTIASLASMEGSQTEEPSVSGMTTAPGAGESSGTAAPSKEGIGASTVPGATAASVGTGTEAPSIAGTIRTSTSETSAPSPSISLVSTEAPSSGLSFFGAEAPPDTTSFSDSSSEASVVVLAAPFSVTYEADGRVAGIADLITTSDITLHYLNRFFIQHFKFRSEATMRRFVSEVIGRATKPARIGYEVRVVLAQGSELPSSEDLDSLLMEALEQPAVQELLDALGQGPTENPLSATDSVTYDPMSPFFLLGGSHQNIPENKEIAEPRSKKKESGLLTAFIILLVFTICFVALVVLRRKVSRRLPEWITKEKTEPQEQNNLMAFRDDENASSTFGSQCYGEISKFTEV